MDNNNKPVQAADAGFYSQLAPNNLPVQRDDEIDLFELLSTLWKAKLQIVLISLLFVILGGAYAFLSTLVFESEFKVTTSKANELYPINKSELVSLSPGDSLSILREEFVSAENFAEFYLLNMARFPEKPENLSEQQFAYQLFSKNLKLVEPKNKKDEVVEVYLGLNYQYPQGVDGYVLINDYLSWVDTKIKSRLKKDFLELRENQLEENQKKLNKLLADYQVDTYAKIERLKEADEFSRKELQDSLAALKVKLLALNQQRIQILNENIAIARQLKFKKPTSPSDAKEQVASVSAEVIKAEFSSLDQLPMYFRGYESLEAEKVELSKRNIRNFPSEEISELERKIKMLDDNREIEKLLTRKQPKLFLDAYIELEQKNTYLNALEMHEMDAHLFAMQSKALPPIKPIKPKKLLILVLSGLLGGMFAVLFVLVRSAMRNRQKSVELV